MKLLKKCNIPLLIGAIVAAALFIVGSIFDKSISETFWNRYQLDIPWFTIVITLLGPLVTNVFGAFAGSSLFFVKTNFKKGLANFFKVIGILGIIAVSFFAYDAGTEFAEVIPHLEDERVRSGLYYLVFALVVITDVIIFLLVYRNHKRVDQRNLFWVASTMLIVLAITAGGTEVIKYIVSRPRPRIVFPGQETYLDWWQWRPLYGFKVHESKSFISGHSSNAGSVAVLLTLFISVTKVNEKKHLATLTSVIGILYAFIVALSRVVAIAHFMSDIAFGLLYSFVVSMVVGRVMLYFNEKAENKVPASN